MTTILQLNPPFHVWVPESEDFGLALFLIDYHVEEHLYWVCAMEKTGELWTLSNDKIRMDTNRSIGRVYDKRRVSGTDKPAAAGAAQHQALAKLVGSSFPGYGPDWKRVAPLSVSNSEASRREAPHRSENYPRVKLKKQS